MFSSRRIAAIASGARSTKRSECSVVGALVERRRLQGDPAAESGAADLAILGIRLPAEGDSFESLYHRMNELLAALPTTLLVHSAPNFEGEPLLFDEPPHP